ncbi:hypothetical protein [Roseivirga pacifica]|uniref:hypothetical protein n=1 Tax=Roseivirga pacifica TaxID=1267423 RepID=UPI003BAB84A4
MKQLTLLLLVIPYYAFGQKMSISEEANMVAKLQLIEEIEKFDSAPLENYYPKEHNKSPLVFENWKTVKINLHSGESFDSISVNIDGQLNKLVADFGVYDVPIELNSEIIYSFSTYDTQPTTFLVLSNKEAPMIDTEYGFFEVLTSKPDLKILKHTEKILKKAEYTITYGSESTKDRYAYFETYYLKTENGEYQEISLTKNNLRKMLGKSNFRKAQAFVNQESLDWRNDTHLAKVISEFY